MSMKIAKIFNGNPNNQKGYFNNVIQRTKHLIEQHPNTDCYMIRIEYGIILKLLKRKNIYRKKYKYTYIENIKFENIWIKMGVIDYLLTHKLHIKLTSSQWSLKQHSKKFERYSVISSHGIAGNYLASKINDRFNIPFVSTWHGSDINIKPFYSKVTKSEIRNIIESARHNFFVSEKLLETSNSITTYASKSVLYTGPSSYFYEFAPNNKKNLKEKYSLKTERVIGYVGNLVQIKNILTLPEIFKCIQEIYNDEITFIVVGDGPLKGALIQKLNSNNILNLKILGRQKPNILPEIFNCLDCLIIPSLNEGLPRVTLEALSCGVHVVGSNRGGIPEAIGIDNTFELNDDFTKNISYRAVSLINSNIKPKLPSKFSWDKALEKEMAVYTKACNTTRTVKTKTKSKNNQ